MRVPA